MVPVPSPCSGWTQGSWAGNGGFRAEQEHPELDTATSCHHLLHSDILPTVRAPLEGRHRHMGTRTYGWMDGSRQMGTWMLGHCSRWGHRCMGTWMQGYMDTWEYRCMDAGINGYLGT